MVVWFNGYREDGMSLDQIKARGFIAAAERLGNQDCIIVQPKDDGVWNNARDADHLAEMVTSLSKQYNILADSVDEANNKQQFLTGHSIANSAFPLTIHKKIGEEGEYNSEFYMARGSYVSDLATFGEDNDRTK